MIEISIPEIVGGGFLLLLLNIGLWIFAWGRLVGRVLETVENQKKRLEEHETTHHSHEVLPACQNEFEKIAGDLGYLRGKMEAFLKVGKTHGLSID